MEVGSVGLSFEQNTSRKDTGRFKDGCIKKKYLIYDTRFVNRFKIVYRRNTGILLTFFVYYKES